jgi:predicted RNA-binding Zn ribbon-like protein
MNVDLPTHLDLPLASGEPYWYWLGGRPALDLVNTLRERWWRRVECLVTPGDLSAWLAAAGLTEAPVPATAAHLAAARRLREAIDALVVAVVAGAPPPPAAVAEVDRRLHDAVAVPCLTAGPAGPELGAHAPADPVRAALGAVALDAARMLGTADRERVRICAGDTCSARFADRSPAGRRRWCSMGACGNRAKATRHRNRRQRSGADAEVNR